MSNGKKVEGKTTDQALPQKSPEETLLDHEHRDEILDEALEETFPASDPIELASDRET